MGSDSTVKPIASPAHRLIPGSSPRPKGRGGGAEPFHVLAPGLQFAGVVIPDLGVFVWPDEVTLDYRMGPEWGRRQLLALFELLRQLVAATGGRMGLGQHVLPAVDRLFVGEWEAYCAGYGSGA